MSIYTGATPLSREEWRQSNTLTARCLQAIAEQGGPRCCKRNTFLALAETRRYLAAHHGVTLPGDGRPVCRFSASNRECLLADCPFHAAG